MTDKVIKIGGQEFEEISPTVTAASRMLADTWEFLGRPETPLSGPGEKLMAAIIAVWEELYPYEAKKWYRERGDYKVNELTITEQVHQHTGRSLASYPYPVFLMMKKLFPKFKPGDRESCMKLIKKFPMFKLVNRV